MEVRPSAHKHGISDDNIRHAINNAIAAFILDSANVQSALGVNVSADDTATISAVIVSVSMAVGMSAVAVGISLAENIIADDVLASIGGSSVTASNGDISVTASYVPTVDTVSVTAAVAAAPGLATAGATSSVTIGGTTEAYIDGSTLTALGHMVSISSTSIANELPSTSAVGAGLAAIAVMTSSATITGATNAYATGDSTISANGLEILANATNFTTPEVIVSSVGGITGAGASATSVISRTTDAYIGDGGSVSAGTGPVTVSATSNSWVDGSTTAVGGAFLGGITALVVESTISGHTIASIGADAGLAASGR